MEINFEKINETYGNSIIELINKNKEDIMSNIEYLKLLNFTDIEDIFERYTPIFIETPSSFKEKINRLINELGENYVEIIENDLFILEQLL